MLQIHTYAFPCVAGDREGEKGFSGASVKRCPEEKVKKMKNLTVERSLPSCHVCKPCMRHQHVRAREPCLCTAAVAAGLHSGSYTRMLKILNSCTVSGG